MGHSYGEYSFLLKKSRCRGELHVCLWVKSDCWTRNISAYLWSTLSWQTSSIKGTTQWYTDKMRQFSSILKRYEECFNFSKFETGHGDLLLLLLKDVPMASFISTFAGFAAGSVDGRVALEISDSSISNEIGSVLDDNLLISHIQKKTYCISRKRKKSTTREKFSSKILQVCFSTSSPTFLHILLLSYPPTGTLHIFMFPRGSFPLTI